MMATFAKDLWRVYPNCRLHVEVAEAGVNSYQIIVRLLDANQEPLYALEHFGTGDLFDVKHEAVESVMRLALAAPTG
jgi:hypothetical protein